MPDSTSQSATGLLKLYRSKQLSPVEATQAALAQISKYDPVLNAFCIVDEEAALKRARISETRWMKGQPMGSLDGVPVSIKDLILTADLPTLRGSQTVAKDQPWNEDAPSTARLREHGAIILGKTTTPEFGWKGVTDSPLTGTTCNPWNLAMTPGGSSGGAAAATASGMCALAIGTDGGGSIRIPAGFTGLYGIKATFGRVPAAPMSPFGTLAHVGPITRTVSDAALLLTVLSEPDPRDWHALAYDKADFRHDLEVGIENLTIAFSPNLGYATVDNEVAGLVAKAAQVFENLGARVDEVTPGFNDPRDTYQTHWYAGAANLTRDFTPEHRALLDPGLAEIAAAGADISVLDYLQAVNERGALGQQMKLFHERYDLLLTPTLPIPAFPINQEVPHPESQARWFDWTPFSFPFNLTGQPAASIPCGKTTSGLPVGLQILATHYREDLVLRASRAFESIHPISMPDLTRLEV